MGVSGTWDALGFRVFTGESHFLGPYFWMSDDKDRFLSSPIADDEPGPADESQSDDADVGNIGDW